MTEDVNEEAKFEEDGAKDVDAKEAHAPPPPCILLHVPAAAAANAWYPSRSHRSVAGNTPYNTYISINTVNNKNYDEDAALLNVHADAGYKLQ